MNAPDKPGYYWATGPDGDRGIVKVITWGNPMLRAVTFGWAKWPLPLEEFRDWSPEIVEEKP